MLCAGAPDTPEIEAEVVSLVSSLSSSRTGVVWIREMLPRADVVALLSAATAFVCPSIYEPLGIVNLEAMACETAVVATATGGIPEVVVDGETGRLVPIEQATDGTGTPLDPDQYVADFAAALNEVVGDPDRAAEMGRRRPDPRSGVVRLAGHRRTDHGGLPLGALTLAAPACRARASRRHLWTDCGSKRRLSAPHSPALWTAVRATSRTAAASGSWTSHRSARPSGPKPISRRPGVTS